MTATTSPGRTRTLRATHRQWDSPLTLPAMSNTEDVHARYRVTSRSVEIGGKPAIPVSGEVHFSRLPRERWEDRLRLMKAGGITVVATYTFWIHHEPREGQASFDGNLDVADFVRLCDSVGLDVVLRIGPWCHGEVRNGGFPDWVQAADVHHRTNDPAYLRLVRRWFGRLGEELRGLLGPDSNVIGIQLENELYDQPGHLTELKKLAREAGLTAPIWTATGWGGADLPPEVLPLFGGYGDGFWVEADSPWDPTFREHYFFSHVWDDPGIGADLREHLGSGSGTAAGAAAPRTPSALYPAATCELAGGMATAYQRRPWPRGLDVAAVGHNKIGNGSAWQGYYMFAGGTNPADGLQESHATGYPNDLPRFDYDFHAPIGASGRLASSFPALRKQHAFLAAFGDRLAQMPSTLPDEMPAGIEDASTLRWALRSDGTSGFVFITWHQPHVPLEAHPGAQFEIGLDGGSVTFPRTPADIPAGTIAHWPVNLDVAGVTLEWATASPLTVLSPGSAPTLVLAAEAGIPVELRFAEGTSVTGPAVPQGDRAYTVDASQPTVLTAGSGNSVLDILVLPAAAADAAWVLETSRDRELVLSADPVWVTESGSLAGRSAGRPDVRRYSPETRSFTAIAADGAAGASPGATSSVSPDVSTAARPVTTELLRAAQAVPASYGSLSGRASAPSPDTVDALAEIHSLRIPDSAFADGPFAAAAPAELEVEWAGDIAQLLVDGRVVADRYWDGSPWVVEIHDAGISAGSDVTLQILPLSREAEVGVPAEAQRRRDEAGGDLAALDAVRLVRWTGWQESA
ncbi:beta-galactosidase [Arthrobacter sp. S39]|uniref:beta-galactosidase n=1 Tax=Arthrobacter sp. S39 TaxID=2509720 RepID=UPI00103765C3|nr:beta-galactosidase [Arthrobacter sp. S39]TAP43361.1 beta-galactosidase [Arthrobacter sp. S39]